MYKNSETLGFKISGNYKFRTGQNVAIIGDSNYYQIVDFRIKVDKKRKIKYFQYYLSFNENNLGQWFYEYQLCEEKKSIDDETKKRNKIKISKYKNTIVAFSKKILLPLLFKFLKKP